MFFGIIATVSVAVGASPPPRQAPGCAERQQAEARVASATAIVRRVICSPVFTDSPRLISRSRPAAPRPDADGDDQQDAGQHAGQLRRLIGETQAVGSTPSATNPSIVPQTLPRPPKIDVPPRTTAVIADSSKPVPASARA